jgi:hypothetical protein
MAEAIKKIQLDTTLSEDEKNKKIEDLTIYYQGLYTYWTNELGFATDRASALYESDWAKYSEMTGYKISAEE